MAPAMSATSELGRLKAELVATLLERRGSTGGFRALAVDAPEAETAEATAWSAVALSLAVPAAAARRAAADSLARMQSPDGRLSTHPLHPGAYSPTSVAVLAWSADLRRDAERKRAVDFLLAHAGTTFVRDPESPLEMDTEIAGWPWIDRTFSWVEPTAMALLALAAAGLAQHPRARAGRALLFDRQLASGGWNYGNARAFGAELRPAPESTGLVLAALAGAAPESRVERSLARLRVDLPRLRTPLAFAWSLLAASAWGRRPAPAETQSAIREILGRAARYGGYETAELALLLLALVAERGLLPAVSEMAEIAEIPASTEIAALKSAATDRP